MALGPVIDLYGGMGDSLALLSHALQAQQGAKLVTFERDQQRSPDLKRLEACVFEA